MKRHCCISGIFILLTSILLILSSCGNNGCEETRESYLYATLKATGRFNIRSINAWALTEDGDSLKLSVSTPNALEFNLKPDTTFTAFRLQCIYDDLGDAYQIDDTLTVHYESYPYYLNMECSCSMFYVINDINVTNHMFKSLSVESNEITNNEKINIILKY